jgi:hypothetical protein
MMNFMTFGFVFSLNFDRFYTPGSGSAFRMRIQEANRMRIRIRNTDLKTKVKKTKKCQRTFPREIRVPAGADLDYPLVTTYTGISPASAAVSSSFPPNPGRFWPRDDPRLPRWF